MNTQDTIKAPVLLLTEGTGQGTKGKATGSTGKRAAARQARDKERAARVARVARFRRDGGTILPRGPVIAAGPGWDWEWFAAHVLHGVMERGARMRAVASRWRATVEGIRRGNAARAAAVIVRELAPTGEGLEVRLALLSEAGKVAKLSAAERAALRDARRAARIAKAHRPESLRPVHALALDAIGTARLAALCGEGARRWVRLFEANGGRTVEPSDVEEIECIFRRAGIEAAKLCGVVPPDARCVWQWRGGEVLPAVALRAWRRALRRAGSAARSYLWGKGRELCEVVSLDDLARLRAVAMGAEDGRCWTVSSAQTCTQDTPLVEEIAAEATKGRRPAVRRLCARWGDYVRVFWMLSGSRKWRAGLASDLRLLGSAARIARGAGLAVLASEYIGDGSEASRALVCAGAALRQHIAAGRVLCTSAETIGAADAVLANRRAVRRFVSVPYTVRAGDIVGSAQ